MTGRRRKPTVSEYKTVASYTETSMLLRSVAVFLAGFGAGSGLVLDLVLPRKELLSLGGWSVAVSFACAVVGLIFYYVLHRRHVGVLLVKLPV